MKILFQLDDSEYSVTPIKIAEALANDNSISVTDIKELADYLYTYATYHSDRNKGEACDECLKNFR